MTSASTSKDTGRQAATESARSGPPTPDEIRRAINFMACLGQPALQKALAQIIAGAIADTDHIAMQQFAATGEFDTEALLDELDQIEVPFEQEVWVDALARFVLFTSGGRS